MKILAVDDSSTMRRLIQKTLTEMGFSDAVFSDSAESAGRVLEGEKIDVILLDWHMPGKNGLEFLKDIKANEDWKKIPVIMLTVEHETHNIELAIENGAEGYIMKPLNKDILRARLDDISGGHTLGLDPAQGD